MVFSDFMSQLPWLAQMAIRLAVAGMLGGLIGIERERRGRSAGFRTQMLVAVGAALATLVGIEFANSYAAGPGVRVDPSRVAYGVMGGIGFLGAGAIISHGPNVRGLTTAASLWCTAAIGLAMGLGRFELALCGTAIVLFALWVLRRVDQRVFSRWEKSVRLTFTEDAMELPALREALHSGGFHVDDWGVARGRDGERTVTLRVSSTKVGPDRLLTLIEGLNGVKEMSVE
jgi:putative Mg2+ transporter-C (MgtC) family protein